jgi:cephalosporin hydroxylase
MLIIPTRKSQNLVKKLVSEMEGHTFHHHYHILYDIITAIEKPPLIPINYLEIGTFGGASCSLVLSHPKDINAFCLDTFKEAPIDLVERNLNRFKKPFDNFKTIVGDSQKEETLEMVKRSIVEVVKRSISIDLFYIDGDHSYQGCMNDFLNYSDLVVSGGYIVFDDYHDVEYSPQVKHAVDYIVSELLFNQYDVIGSFRNSLGAKPSEMIFNNEFILRKK